MNPWMTVGSYVRLKVPSDRRTDAFARGRIVATQTYEDFQGSRLTLFVRWFCADGKPDDAPKQHEWDELERIQGASNAE